MAKYGFADYFKDFSYRLFGRRIPEFPTFRSDYHKSGLKTVYELYVSMIIFACFTSFISTFILGLVIQNTWLKIPLGLSLIGSLFLGFISVLVISVSLTARPLLLARKNRAEIDSNLIYTVGYMGVLSAGGVSIERTFDRVMEVEPRSAIRELAMRFNTNVKMFGLDVASSLSDVRERSASEVFAKLLLSITNTVRTSGDLKSLLAFETSRLLALKREQLKKTLSSMVALAELYITAMVMAPITFIIMITILSVLGTAQSGLSPATQLNLIVFFGIPLICIVFIVVLDGVLPKEG